MLVCLNLVISQCTELFVHVRLLDGLHFVSFELLVPSLHLPVPLSPMFSVQVPVLFCSYGLTLIWLPVCLLFNFVLLFLLLMFSIKSRLFSHSVTYVVVWVHFFQIVLMQQPVSHLESRWLCLGGSQLVSTVSLESCNESIYSFYIFLCLAWSSWFQSSSCRQLLK